MASDLTPADAKQMARMLISNAIQLVMDIKSPSGTSINDAAERQKALLNEIIIEAYSKVPVHWSAAKEFSGVKPPLPTLAPPTNSDGFAWLSSLQTATSGTCDKPDDDGSSLLHREVALGRADNVKALLESSPDLFTTPNNLGQWPIQLLTVDRYFLLAAPFLNLGHKVEESIRFFDFSRTSCPHNEELSDKWDQFTSFVSVLRSLIFTAKDKQMQAILEHFIKKGDLATIVLWCHVVSTTPSSERQNIASAFKFGIQQSPTFDVKAPEIATFITSDKSVKYSFEFSEPLMKQRFAFLKLGTSPLLAAIEHRQPDILRFLVKYWGMEVNSPKDSPLLFTLMSEKVRGIRDVKGAVIDGKDLHHWYASEMEILNYRKEVAKILMCELEADPFASGRSAVHAIYVPAVNCCTDLIVHEIDKRGSIVYDTLAICFPYLVEQIDLFENEKLFIPKEVKEKIQREQFPVQILNYLFQIQEAFEFIAIVKESKTLIAAGDCIDICDKATMLVRLHFQLLSRCRFRAFNIQFLDSANFAFNQDESTTKYLSDVKSCLQLTYGENQSDVDWPFPSELDNMFLSSPALMSIALLVKIGIPTGLNADSAPNTLLTQALQQPEQVSVVNVIPLLQVLTASTAVLTHMRDPYKVRPSNILSQNLKGDNISTEEGTNGVSYISLVPHVSVTDETFLHQAVKATNVSAAQFVLETVLRQEKDGHYGSNEVKTKNHANGVKALLDFWTPKYSSNLSPLAMVVEARTFEGLSALQLTLSCLFTRHTADGTRCTQLIKMLIEVGKATAVSYQTFYKWLQLQENPDAENSLTVSHDKPIAFVMKTVPPSAQKPTFAFGSGNAFTATFGSKAESVRSYDYIVPGHSPFFSRLPKPTAKFQHTANVISYACCIGASALAIEFLLSTILERDSKVSSFDSNSTDKNLPNSLNDGNLPALNAFMWNCFVKINIVWGGSPLPVLYTLLAQGLNVNSPCKDHSDSFKLLPREPTFEGAVPIEVLNSCPPLCLAVKLLEKSKLNSVEELLSSLSAEIIGILLDAGADPEQADGKGTAISSQVYRILIS